MNWKTIRKYLPIIGIALFVYLLIKLDITKIFVQIKNINFSYFSIAIIFVIIFLIFQTLKWFIIAKKQKIEIPFKEALKINLITNFYGFVTPAKLGSLIRVDYLRKYKGDTGKGLSNFFIDKILDLSSLFFLAIGFGLIFYEKTKIPLRYLYILLAIFLAIVLLSFIFYKKEHSRFFLRFIYRKFIPERMKEKTRIAFDSFYKDMPSFMFLFFVFIINLMNWVINYSIVYFVGLSLGIDIGLAPFFVILPISTLVAQIPITISGFGTRELTMISLFNLFRVEAVKVFSMSILSIIITSIIPSIIVIFFLFKKERK